MIHKTRTKALSWLLSLALVMGLLPGMAIIARAEGGYLSGSGTASDPYLIQSEEDWNTFASTIRYEDELYFALTEDITVSQMVDWGGNNMSFRHHFDGRNHTLTFNAKTDQENCAPFRETANAKISNLNTAGTIRTSAQFASGLIAEVVGGSYDYNTVIENCTSSVVIESSAAGDGTHGGFIAHMEGGYPGATIENCVFNGQIKGASTTSCGGFAGWIVNGGTLTITNSVYAPSGEA